MFIYSIETAMGTTVDAQTNPQNEYLQAVRRMCWITSMRGENVIYTNDFFYGLSDYYREELKIVKTLVDFSTNIIKNRRKVLEAKTDQDAVEYDEFGKRKKMTFLDILLKGSIDGKPLSDEDIREEVDTFLFEVKYNKVIEFL